ncbi:MAG TPA: heme biosynthesis HemY N-terminal domain-containing protein [Mariprofundaceae bacterium]|nr:heme biosynthesis HemY N-terminal domain-containing protein [Mariprofundaceae bacterium]
MRIFVLLLLALTVVLLFTLFPEVVSQHVRLEAFGWVFETRQGAFITALLVLLSLLWLLQRVVSAIFAGPGQLWRTLRMGSKKRREQRLREGVADLLDMRGDQGKRAFGKSRGVIPEWAASLLKTVTIPANEQPLPDGEGNPLNIAMAARIATDPNAPSRPDAATRKAHLEAWLNVHPEAPLAISRLAALAEDEGDWARAVELLEQSWKQGQRSAASIKPRLAQAYIELASEDRKNRQSHLRKAHRLAPENSGVILALGKAQMKAKNNSAAEKLWLSYLEQHNDFNVAKALLKLLKKEALQGFRKLDKKDAATTYQPSMRWLQASLAHAAGLTGLAIEIMDQLLEKESAPEVLRTRAEWHTEAGEWQQATDYYRLLCDQ